jgi:hypothetical protein
MLARRPHSQGAPAFGHVNVSPEGRTALDRVLKGLLRAESRTHVQFHPDDLAGHGEVLVAPLQNFDQFFQPDAPWSLERAVDEVRASGSPATLGAAAVRGGGWSFYVIRTKVEAKDVVAVRAQSPTYGLKAQAKVITRFVGEELKLVKEPLVAFDEKAEALVVDATVYVLKPRQLESLLIDADAVKARAPQTAAAFEQGLGAPLAAATVAAVERVCSRNANVARRLERILRDADLALVTSDELRAALPDAGHALGDFGSGAAIDAASDVLATLLIDVAADLYYQPRFSAAPRRVAVYRRVG